MNNPTEDGLSSDEEYPMLCDIEDEVIDRLESLEDIFAGTVKTQGRLELYVFTKNPEKVLEEVQKLKSESVIKVIGEVKERSNKNPNIPTGEIEIFAKKLKF